MKRWILLISLASITSCSTHILRPDYENVSWSKTGSKESRIRFEVANVSHLANEDVTSTLRTALSQQGYSSESGKCPRDCDLFVTVSDRQHSEDGPVLLSAFFSGLTLGILPMKTPRTDVVVTYQIRDAKKNLFLRTYSLSHYAVGSFWVVAFPGAEMRVNSEIISALERVTHAFLNDYEKALAGGSLPTLYQRVSLKDGREFFFVGLKEAGAECTILLNNGKTVQISSDSIQAKKIMTEPVRMVGRAVW